MAHENFPKGWHLRKEFIDPDTGDVYNFGKLKGKETVTDPITPPQQELQQESQQESKKSTADELYAMKLEAKIANLERIIQSVQLQPTTVNVRQEEKLFGEYDESRIADKENDFLQQPICYVRHGRGYSMSVYIKNGKQHLAPHNIPIYFKREFDEVIHHENGSKVIPFCRFVCNSKADMEFIENSPYYNVTIYRDYEKAKNVDLGIIDKYEGAILNVQRMNDNELMAACVAKQIDIKQPKDALKNSLIQRLIRDYMVQDEALIGARQEKMKSELFNPPTL